MQVQKRRQELFFHQVARGAKNHQHRGGLTEHLVGTGMLHNITESIAGKRFRLVPLF